MRDVFLEPGLEPDRQPRRRAKVARNSGDFEWFSPAEAVAAARRAMGGIDLDPASTPEANASVRAAAILTRQDDGLSREWRGRIWLNPPYQSGLAAKFARKLIVELESGRVSQACLLVNNSTETRWFQALLQRAAAVCLWSGRMRFWHPSKADSSQALQGQAVLYFGASHDKFSSEFERYGCVLARLPSQARVDIEWDCGRDGCWAQKQQLKFRAFSGCLPGKIEFTDVDAAVEVKNRFLALEWKAKVEPVPTGQHLMYERLTAGDRRITVVYVVGCPQDMSVSMSAVMRGGRLSDYSQDTLDGLRDKIRRWAAGEELLVEPPEAKSGKK